MRIKLIMIMRILRNLRITNLWLVAAGNPPTAVWLVVIVASALPVAPEA